MPTALQTLIGLGFLGLVVFALVSYAKRRKAADADLEFGAGTAGEEPEEAEDDDVEWEDQPGEKQA